MPISLKCDQCGKQYQVGDQLAGKRIKCKDCGATMAVPAAGAAAAKPASKAAPPTKAAPTSADSITATCGSCGKQVQAKSSLAGKRVKCQQCGSAVTLPGGAPAAAPPATPTVRPKPAVAAPAAPAAPRVAQSSLLDEAGAVPMLPNVSQMYCPGCKAIIAANAVLCVKCGLKLETGRTMASQNTANKPVYKPGTMTAWGYIGGALGILYSLAAGGFNGLMIWASLIVLIALGLPSEANPGSAFAFFGLPVFILMFTASMLMLVSSINILRCIKGAIPNAALASKIFVGAYTLVMVFLISLTMYGIYKASKATQAPGAVAGAATTPNAKAPPPPNFRGAARALHGFALAAAITVDLVLWTLMVTAMVIGVPIYLLIFAGTQGKRIDWELPEPLYQARKGGLKVIDPTKKPEAVPVKK